MIKESFLRNYNIGRLYSEAEHQKKKLQVLIIRQFNRELRERYERHQEVQRKRRTEENWRERKGNQKIVRDIEVEERQKNRSRALLSRVKKERIGIRTEGNQGGVGGLNRVQLAVSTIKIKNGLEIQKEEYWEFQKRRIQKNKNFVLRKANTTSSHHRTSEVLDNKTERNNNCLPHKPTAPSIHEDIGDNIDAFSTPKSSPLGTVQKYMARHRSKKKLKTQQNQQRSQRYRQCEESTKLGDLPFVTPKSIATQHGLRPKYVNRDGK